MSLVARIAALAVRVAVEVRGKIDANHPGVSRAWVRFSCKEQHLYVHRLHNIAFVERLGTGHYRIVLSHPTHDADYLWLIQANVRRLWCVGSKPLFTHVDPGRDALTVRCTNVFGWPRDCDDFQLLVFR